MSTRNARVSSGRLTNGGAPALRAHLAQDALEPGLRLNVDVGHRRGHRGVDLADEPVHLVRDSAVAGVPFAPRAQLDELHRLPRVEIEHVPNAEGEAQGVARLALPALAGEPLPFAA